MDAVITIAPRSPSAPAPPAAMAAAASRRTLKVPIKFTRTTVSNGWSAAGPSLPTVRSAQPIPAQETASLSPPAASTAALTCSSLVTSALTKAASSSDASAAPRSSFRSAIVTRAPRATSSRAVASPRPEAPPATSAPTPSSCMEAGSLKRRRESQPEQPRAVGEEVVEVEPGRVELALNRRARELGADLGADLLAVGEGHLEIGAVDPNALRPVGPQAHLDPRVGLVEEGDVLERLGFEVRLERGVDHAQHVAIELGRQTGAVVVRGLEHGTILHQVGPDHEPIVGSHRLPHPCQETRALVRIEVSDRAAEEREQPAPPVRDAPEVAPEVAYDAVHPQARVQLRELERACPQNRFVHVERHVAAEAALSGHCVESARVLDAVPEPSSTSSSAPLRSTIEGAWRLRIWRSQRVG